MDELLRFVPPFVISGLVVAPLEILLPARARPGFSWARYRTDILHALVGGLLIRTGTALLLGLLYAQFGTLASADRLPLALQLLCVLLVSDFMFWSAHRIYHAVPFLWRFHRIHHSSEHLDWLAAYRVHPVDQIINATLIALPAMLFGFSPLALAIYHAVYRWHAILLHSNVKLSFGPLNAVITSPGFHHWHHANHEEAHDKNFGGQLVIWDRLFGTAYRPAQERPTRYGVDSPPPQSFAAQIIEPFLPRTKNG